MSRLITFLPGFHDQKDRIFSPQAVKFFKIFTREPASSTLQLHLQDILQLRVACRLFNTALAPPSSSPYSVGPTPAAKSELRFNVGAALC